MRSEQLKILLVEDSPLTREQVCELINGIGTSVDISTAATEKEALAAVEKSAPDVVVLDLRLKQGSGFSVLRHLTKLKPKPLIIVMTNYALPQFREYAVLTGADYFLDKAIQLDSLPTMIEETVERKLH